MSKTTALAESEPTRRLSLLVSMAHRFDMEPKAFEATLKATVMPQQHTNEQFAAFLMVCREYDLNPLTKEIYAFPSRGGGVQPIVSIDGWMKMMNAHPQFDGMEFVDQLDDDGNLTAITCRMYRKDRQHPTEVTEYMNECKRNTDVWKTWPARMLRHKAAIQAARYAFGFSGIYEPDEAGRMSQAAVIDVEAEPAASKTEQVKQKLKKIAPPPDKVVGPSLAEITDQMNKAVQAKNRDALDLAMDAAGALESQEHREEAGKHYEHCVAQLDEHQAELPV